MPSGFLMRPLLNGGTLGGRMHVSPQRHVLALLAGLVLVAPPRLALADGGCQGCSESLGCLWVCTVASSIFALPLWILFAAGSALLNRRFRVARPHVLSLPLSLLSGILTAQFATASLFAWVFLPVLPLLWYLALAKLPALRWFTEPKSRRTTDWRTKPAEP